MHMREDSRTIPGRLGEGKVAGKRAHMGDEIDRNALRQSGLIQEVPFALGGSARGWAAARRRDRRQEAQDERPPGR